MGKSIDAHVDVDMRYAYRGVNLYVHVCTYEQKSTRIGPHVDVHTAHGTRMANTHGSSIRISYGDQGQKSHSTSRIPKPWIAVVMPWNRRKCMECMRF